MPRCVHCGYDMTGVLARDEAQRDATRTCPECGGVWSESLERAAPRWPGWPKFIAHCITWQAIAWGVVLALLIAAKYSMFVNSFAPAIAYPLALVVGVVGWIIVIIVLLQTAKVAKHLRPHGSMLTLVAVTAHTTLITIAVMILRYVVW